MLLSYLLSYYFIPQVPLVSKINPANKSKKSKGYEGLMVFWKLLEIWLFYSL